MTDRRKAGMNRLAILRCIVVWIGCVAVGVGTTAYLVNAEVIALHHVGYASTLILLTASIFSAWAMSRKTALDLKRWALLIAGNVTAYILICVVLFSGVELVAIPSVLVIAGGGAVPLLLQNARNKKPKYKMRKRPTG